MMICLNQDCVLLLMQSSDNLAGTHPVHKLVPKLLQLSSSAVLAH